MVVKSATNQKAKEIKKMIFAIPTAAPAMLVKPSNPAMIATIKNEIVQLNMCTAPQIFNTFSLSKLM